MHPPPRAPRIQQSPPGASEDLSSLRERDERFLGALDEVKTLIRGIAPSPGKEPMPTSVTASGGSSPAPSFTPRALAEGVDTSATPAPAAAAVPGATPPSASASVPASASSLHARSGLEIDYSNGKASSPSLSLGGGSALGNGSPSLSSPSGSVSVLGTPRPGVLSEPTSSQKPAAFQEIMEMLARNETPPNVRDDIDDGVKVPGMLPTASSAERPSKPWMLNAHANGTSPNAMPTYASPTIRGGGGGGGGMGMGMGMGGGAYPSDERAHHVEEIGGGSGEGSSSSAAAAAGGDGAGPSWRPPPVPASRIGGTPSSP